MKEREKWMERRENRENERNKMKTKVGGGGVGGDGAAAAVAPAPAHHFNHWSPMLSPVSWVRSFGHLVIWWQKKPRGHHRPITAALADDSLNFLY